MPSRLVLILLSVGVAVCALATIDPRAVLVALAVNVFVLVGVWLQGRNIRDDSVNAVRDWGGQPQAGKNAMFRITLENRLSRSVRVRVEQPWPSTVDAEEDRWDVPLGPRETVTLETRATPRDRGPLVLPPLTLDLALPASLAVFRSVREDGGTATVLPDMSAVRHYEKLRRSRALRAAGFHRQRTIGLGREFDQMREYVRGDDFRDINWKATARTGVPRTNHYQVERSRDLLLCIDAGRLMGSPVGRRTALDHAVDAALLLTYAAHDQADRVGLVTFADRVETVIRPATTNGSHILKTLAALESRPLFPNYLSLVETLRSRQTHRGLIFLLTDLSDPQLSEDLVDAMPLLVARHLVVVVSLRDALFERVASGQETDRRFGVTHVFAARQLARERRQRSAQLRKAGVSVLEADAEQLTLAVMNHYLAVKSRQLI
ncbi:MAG: DUF58 domain-containing protein [Planctomycetota bacterium]